MKAVVFNQYGPPGVLRMQEVETPKPESNEILIRNYATSVNSGDWHLRKADPLVVRLFFGLTRPRKKILGVVIAGVVEETGHEVTRFRKGDAVFGSTGMNMGSYAEYTVLPEDAVISLMPDNIDFEEAAAIPFGANTALYFLRKAEIREGDRVLIYGASGAVGTAAVQLAKYFGAEVTGVCSTTNMSLVRELGADFTLDYRTQDFSETKKPYDVLFDTVGRTSFSEAMKVLTEHGTLIMGSAGFARMLRGMLTSVWGRRKVITGLMKETPEDMEFIKERVEQGDLKPVIDRYYSMEEIVEAHEYVEKGHKKGNVVITISRTANSSMSKSA